MYAFRPSKALSRARGIQKEIVMLRIKLLIFGGLLAMSAGCSRTQQQEPPPAPQQQQSVQPTPPPPANPPQAEPAPRPAPQQKPRPAPRRTPVYQAEKTSPAAPPETVPVRPGNTSEPAVPPVRSEAAPVPYTPPAPRYAVIPSGTVVGIRLQDPLDSGVNKAGDSFRGLLEKDLVVDGNVVAPRGAVLVGKLARVERSGRVEGKAQMALELTQMRVAEQSYPIQTNLLSFEAESTKKTDAAKVGIGAGVGAVIGAIAGGGKGAAIGAAVGGGAGGATVLATRGKELKLDAEHQLNFTVQKDVQVRLQ
jgi:hypothetical protein